MEKILVITGASRGIGLATVAKFQLLGWQVFNLSRSKCPISYATHIKCDLSNRKSIDQAIATLKDQFPDKAQVCLIHNAAQYLVGGMLRLDTSAFEQSLMVNLVAPVIVNQALVPHMREGSSILYLGSTLSEKAAPGCAAYVTAKHATVGLMRSTCQDLAGTGIHTACICPGFTDTEMLRGHVSDPEVYAALAETTAAKRIAKPEEIAEILAFCADNPVINDSVIHGNLGQLSS